MYMSSADMCGGWEGAGRRLDFFPMPAERPPADAASGSLYETVNEIWKGSANMHPHIRCATGAAH